MSNVRVRRAAPELLVSARAALNYILNLPPPSEEGREERKAVIDALTTAIDKASFDDTTIMVTLVMTRRSAKNLLEEIEKRNDGGADARRAAEAVNNGMRLTKQRAYLSLPINHAILRWLKTVLTTAKSESEKAFERMAKQIEEEGLSRNPLEILAEMAL